MLLSTQTDRFGQRFGDEKAVRMLADAGFDAIDYSMFGMIRPDHILRSDAAEKYIDTLKAAAEACGVVFNQAHAPFSFKGWDDPAVFNNEIFPTVARAVTLAGRLGVKIIVVHPLHFMQYKGNEEKMYELNMRYYRSLIPYCEKYGIKVATENMWQRDKNRGYIIHDVCSQAKEFNRYLDDLDSEWIVGCLDLGHCGLVGIDAADMIREMGGKHIHALHVHDNDHISDAHVEPFSGKMNWHEIAKALGEVDYQGDSTFEADNYFNPMPEEFMPQGAKYLHDIGRYLMNIVETNRK